MSFSGYAEDENKGKKAKLKDRLKCRICKFGSPKYWQLVLNDIPLLIAIPGAYFLKLIDMVTMCVALFMTVSDFISMITYLLHDDDLSVDSKTIFNLADQRLNKNESNLERLEINSDDDFLLQQIQQANEMESAAVNDPSHAFNDDVEFAPQQSDRKNEGESEKKKVVEIKTPKELKEAEEAKKEKEKTNAASSRTTE